MPNQLTLAEWHERFTQQASWTKDLRRYLYSKSSLATAHRVIDIGCGTGALLPELNMYTGGQIIGLDLSVPHLNMAMRSSPRTLLLQGDALCLPFLSQSFDVALCHFVLLWVRDALHALREMRRIVHPGGFVLAIAEPDYGGRIDYPADLAILGDLQRTSLSRQGANPLLGRELSALFHLAGLVDVECGVLGAQQLTPPALAEWEAEWHVLEADLSQLADFDMDLDRLKSLDRDAWQRGERVMFVPTFYACGVVPE